MQTRLICLQVLILWADTENHLFLQPPLGINSACCQGSRDSGRHSQGEKEKGHHHHICHRLCKQQEQQGQWGGNSHWRCHSGGPTLLPRSNATQALPLGMTALFCFVLSTSPSSFPTLFLAPDNLITEANNIPRTEWQRVTEGSELVPAAWSHPSYLPCRTWTHTQCRWV